MSGCSTCDDVDIGVVVLGELDGVTVPLERFPQLLLHRSRTAETIQTHHLSIKHTQPLHNVTTTLLICVSVWLKPLHCWRCKILHATPYYPLLHEHFLFAAGMESSGVLTCLDWEQLTPGVSVCVKNNWTTLPVTHTHSFRMSSAVGGVKIRGSQWDY